MKSRSYPPGFGIFSTRIDPASVMMWEMFGEPWGESECRVIITLYGGKEIKIDKISYDQATVIMSIIDEEKNHVPKERDLIAEAREKLRGKIIAKKTGIA